MQVFRVFDMLWAVVWEEFIRMEKVNIRFAMVQPATNDWFFTVWI